MAAEAEAGRHRDLDVGGPRLGDQVEPLAEGLVADSKGVTQPFVATNWNPQGYGANPISRIRVLVEA